MTRKATAIIGTAIFFIIAPGIVAGFVPWRISHWRFENDFPAMPVFRFGGGVLIALGVAGLVECCVRFAARGLGTPAPVFPTQRLVVSGLYRRVRNPMYVSVVSAILGQGLLFGSLGVIEYAAIVWLLFHLFVVVYEEPTLRKSFGLEYEIFCQEVPRWIPRVRPWRGNRKT